MKNKLEELKAAVKEFSEKHNVEYETVEYSKQELWDNPDEDYNGPMILDNHVSLIV